MADFTHWCVAGEEVMPWEPGEFQQAYGSNQDESIERALDSDHVANAIHSLMSKAAQWEGTPSALLQALDGVVDERITRLRFWPQTPSVLGKRLTRCQAFLRKSGIKVDRQKGGERLITITNEKAAPAASSNVSISNGQFFE